MNLNSNLTNENLLLYAAKFYDNPNCDGIDEFYNDLSISLHLKKLFNRYYNNAELRERLILNHFISFLNVFPVQAAVRILFLKLDPKIYPLIKTVLVYLGRCPDIKISINNTVINISDIQIDKHLLKKLSEC